MNDPEFIEAYKKALRFLTYKSRTSQEIYSKLIYKGYSGNIIQKVIENLKEKKYLNEEDFVKNWIEIYKKKLGRIKIEALMLQKGIPLELIQEKLKLYLLEEELELAFNLAKRARKNKNLKKMFYFLKNRGFPKEIIFKVINKLYNYERTFS